MTGYLETFGRVDGEEIIEELDEFTKIKEDNDSNRIYVTVVLLNDGTFAFGVQFVPDEVYNEAYPMFHIKGSGYETKEEAANAAAKYWEDHIL